MIANVVLLAGGLVLSTLLLGALVATAVIMFDNGGADWTAYDPDEDEQ